MSKSNKKKSEQLKMNHATAANRLRKMILFRLLQDIRSDRCHRCGELIETVKELSIEHKIPWLDSEDPVGLYFDLDNIAFSHLSCNSGAARRVDRPVREFKIGISGFRGVWWDHVKKLWRAGYRNKTIGYFVNPEDAAKKYDEYAILMHGETALTNKKLGLLRG